MIVGGDDVSRYAADVERLKRNSVPFSYITFAVIPEGRDAPQGMPDSLKNFFTTYTGLFPFAGRPEGRSQDGHAALTYDAALSMITAIKYLREGGEQIPITPAATWHQIGQITAPAQIEGATGTIDFGGDVRGRVPVDKAVYLLQVRDGVVNEAVLGFCGRRNGLVQDVWCPRLREMDQS